jgi:putative transferase (TIGR04331 family)
LIMEGWDIPFQESLMNCKLFVCDHLGSVYAEALSLNVPTILFWDPESHIHRTEAHRYLENLHAVEILHDSPESAASKVCEVYDNVDNWWNDRERQLARLDFCDRYAKNSPNAIDEWINEFRKISR